MYKTFKRIMDLLIAGSTLIILSPFFILIVILLKLTGEGEVFFFQKRVGYRKKEFKIWKFASMIKDSHKFGNPEVTLKNDPRITYLGKFLRLSKINELPQIINVILGDMSIVGPRPLIEVSFNAYLPEHKEKVYLSKPGITGIGSIVLRHEEEIMTAGVIRGEEPVSFYKTQLYPFKGKLEMWYLENKSPYVDLVIIFLTGWVIIRPKSNLVYYIFRDLPQMPVELTI